MMRTILTIAALLLASVCQAGPRERIVIVNTLLRVRLEAVPDLPNDFERGTRDIPVPPPLALVPPEQATTEPDDCFEAYLAPNCGPCEGFVRDWKAGQFRQYTVRSMGTWDGKAHPIFRWRVKGQWWTIEGYRGAAWLIEGMERTKPKPRKKPVAGIVAWTFSVPGRLWTVGGDTKAELVEHLLRDHNTVGLTREQLNGMSRERLVQLHSAFHEGTVKRR